MKKTRQRQIIYNNPEGTPVGGWRFPVRQTGQLITGKNESDLVKNIQAHYNVNGIPAVYDILQQVRTYICEGDPDYCSRRGTHRSPPPGGSSRRLPGLPSIQQVVMFTRAVLGPIALRRFADDRDIMRRSKVCENCPLNVKHEACIPCSSGKFLKFLQLTLGRMWAFTSRYRLNVCKACGCMLRAKVCLKTDDVLKLTSKSAFDALHHACWIRTEKDWKEKEANNGSQ